MRRSALPKLLAGVGLAASLPACNLKPAQRPEVAWEEMPCGRLIVAATSACESVAARCTSFATCFDALDDLRDVPGHFPDREPCDVQISARLREATPADVPKLLEGVERGGFHKRELGLRLLADGNEAIVRVLRADPSPAATLALAARAALHPEAVADFASRERGRAVVEAHIARGAFFSPDDRMLSRPLHAVPLSTHRFAQLFEASETPAGELPTCPAKAPQEADPLLLSAVCQRPTLPGLQPPAVRRDYHGTRGFRSFRESSCTREEKSNGSPWGYRRDSDRWRVAPDRKGWLARVNGYSTGRRRALLCTNVPPFSPIRLQSGTLRVVEGDLVMDRADGTYDVGGFAFAGVRRGPDEALLVEGLFSGDTKYLPSPVVYTFEAATGRRKELASLPGDTVEWISLEEDGALVVATSSWGGERYVSEVTTDGGKSLPCW